MSQINDVMNKSVGLNPRYECVDIVGSDVVLLQSDVGPDFDVIEAPGVGKVIGLLRKGPHQVDDLIRRCRKVLVLDDVLKLLEQLEIDQYVVEWPPDLAPEAVWLSTMLDASPKKIAQALRQTHVALRAFNVEPELFQEGLAAMKIQVKEQADLTVVLVDDYLNPCLKEVNQEALQSRKPWLLVKPVGREFFIGPLFIPGETACLACLAERLLYNTPAQGLREARRDRPVRPSMPRKLPPLATTARDCAAWVLMQWIVHGRHEPDLISFDTRTWQFQRHVVSRLPQCPVCGPERCAVDQEPTLPTLQSRRKRFMTDGGHRQHTPEEAYRQVEHLVDPKTGVIRSMERLDLPGAEQVQIYRADISLMHRIDSLEKLFFDTFYSMGLGKGKTDAQARASALYEAIERLSAVWRGREYVRWNTYHELKPYAFHPNKLLGFSEEQYRTRNAWNATCASSRLYVPAPFDENKKIAWVPVFSVDNRIRRYIPAAFAYFGHPGVPFCFADSNGNAAGTTIEEAILQGFLELIERDAVAIWFYNKLRRPGVDLQSFADPFFAEMQRYYEETLGRDLWVLDVTTDLRIPTMVAVSCRTDRQPESITMGLGCHLDPLIAINRSLTELNQSLPSVLHTAAEDQALKVPEAPMIHGGFTHLSLETDPYLMPSDSKPRTRHDYNRTYAPPLWSEEDVLEDVLTCVKLAQDCELETYVLNLTRADLGVPVVKMVVPGLVHFWRRLGPRRLYEVPVKMGCVEGQRTEEKMNTKSIYM